MRWRKPLSVSFSDFLRVEPRAARRHLQRVRLEGIDTYFLRNSFRGPARRFLDAARPERCCECASRWWEGGAVPGANGLRASGLRGGDEVTDQDRVLYPALALDPAGHVDAPGRQPCD